MLSLRNWMCIFVFGSLLSLAVTQSAAAADTIRLRLDWTPWGDQAPFHLAQEKGLFKKYDLDVSIDDGNGSVSTVQIVGNGQYDVGHAALASMIIARSKGLPVKAIAGFIQKNDIALLVPRDSGIKSPADLKGKKIAFTPGSLEAPFIDKFLAAGNLKRADIDLISVDAAGKGGIYMTGGTDAAFSSAPFFLAVAESKRPSNAVRFADYGLQFPSFGLFATEASIAAKHEALRRFASVVAGCWSYIFDGHEDAGVQAIIAARPQSKLDPKVLRQQIDTLKDYAKTDAVKSLPFGTMALSDWEQATKILSEGALLDQAVNPKDLFTNDMIDPKIVTDVAASLK